MESKKHDRVRAIEFSLYPSKVECRAWAQARPEGEQWRLWFILEKRVNDTWYVVIDKPGYNSIQQFIQATLEEAS